MPLSSKKDIIERCRQLRRDSTESEDNLWQFLRNRNVDRMKFNRQHPIIHFSLDKKYYFFIADFYCHQEKLVIEVDGRIHESQREYDEGRNTIMKELGLKILRVTNDQVEKEMEKVIQLIREVVKK